MVGSGFSLNSLTLYAPGSRPTRLLRSMQLSKSGGLNGGSVVFDMQLTSEIELLLACGRRGEAAERLTIPRIRPRRICRPCIIQDPGIF